MVIISFLKKILFLCILPVTIDFFYLTLHRNNGHQAKLDLYVIKILYYIENDKNSICPPSVCKKVYILTKNGKPIIKKYTNIFESHYQGL